MLFFSLPDEIILLIIGYLNRPRDVFHFSLSSLRGASLVRMEKKQFTQRFEDYFRVNTVHHDSSPLMDSLQRPLFIIKDLLERGARVNYKEGRYGHTGSRE